MRWPAVVSDWGTTASERAQPMPCDRLIPDPDGHLDRACDVDAPAELAWRWLCQISIAPYSYDLLDNRGRRSPRTLTPGAELIEVGQKFIIFRVAEIDRGRSMTLTSKTRAFGEFAVTYAVEPITDRTSRYVARIVMRYPQGWYGRLLRVVLPPGDLVMMRKQLLTFATLAKRSQKERANAIG